MLDKFKAAVPVPSFAKSKIKVSQPFATVEIASVSTDIVGSV